MVDHSGAENRAARYRADIDDASEPVDEQPRRGRRVEDQALWVDHQIREAMARGEFDDLPHAGKPIPHIDTASRPDWWLEKLVEREQITGVLPEALQLRKDDAALDHELAQLASEADVRDRLEQFNARVVAARRQLLGGPPVVTAVRDVDVEVEAWRRRRRGRSQAAPTEPDPTPPRMRWWRRRDRR